MKVPWKVPPAGSVGSGAMALGRVYRFRLGRSGWVVPLDRQTVFTGDVVHRQPLARAAWGERF